MCAYLSFFLPFPAFPHPFPTPRLPDPPRYVRPVPPHSQSTFWQLTLVPSSTLRLPFVRSLPLSLSLFVALLSFSLSFSLLPSVLCYPRFTVLPQSPTYSLLSTLLPPSDSTHLRPPPDTHLPHPTLLSTLYPCSTVPARSPPRNPLPCRCLHPALRLTPTPTTR